MTTKLLALGALGGALMFAVTTAVPAGAAIQCQGRSQWNSAAHGWIPTPYCEDRLISQVSGYPFNGPNGVRQNPSVKAEACRFAGSDIRIRDLCAGFLPEDQGNRRH